MKILITGASGKIAQLVRRCYSNHDVFLLSRGFIETQENEQLIVENVLENFNCNQLKPFGLFDIVFHLAEPVKIPLSESSFNLIFNSHINFLDWSINNSIHTVYPLTAYLYDTYHHSQIKSYVEMKKRIYCHYEGKGIKFPIIHPIIDSNYGSLSKLKIYIDKFHLGLFFANFDSSFPVIYESDLILFIRNVSSFSSGKFDLYSNFLKLNQLSRVNYSRNFYSKFFLFLLSLFKLSKISRLIIMGRKID